jgi:hypothetical protein
MLRWLQGRTDVGDQVAETDRPVPASRELLVYDQPVPPQDGAIRSQAQLIAMWRGFHETADAASAQAALNLDIPPREDVLIRAQTPRYGYRRQRDRMSSITLGRFSQDSSVSCRFVVPEAGKRCCLVLRRSPAAGGEKGSPEEIPVWARGPIDAGCGVLVPMLFLQKETPFGDCRRTLEESYLFTTYNATTHMQQAADVVTVVRMAEVELGVAARDIALVAEAGMGLVGLAAWAFLGRHLDVGPVAADLGGADPADPQVWAEQAYIPLLLAAGGIRALSSLLAGRAGYVCGAAAGAREMLPASFEVTGEPGDLVSLIDAVQRL